MAKDNIDINILTHTKKAMGGIKSMMKSLVKLGAVVVGFRSLQQIVNKSVAAYTEQIKAETKLTAILKSTGNQLGMSQKELQTYASELQGLTGVGDEVIINAQAQMATFTKIGNEVFPRAIESALDLSKAFGTDLKSSTIQVGKALQDPIKGVTALRRVGVQLSDQQTESIKKFMEMGDIASAQKIILGELETQVGGVAKAYGETIPGQLEIFKADMGDISEGLGEAVMVGLAPIVNEANKFMKDNKEKIINVMKNLPDIILEIMEFVKNIIKKAFSFEGFKATFIALASGMVSVFKVAIKAIPQLFLTALNFLLVPIKNFGAWVGSVFEKIFADVGNFFIDALNALPFVEIERIGEKTVDDLGEVGKRTLDEMAVVFADFSATLLKALSEIVSVAEDTGGELKEIVAEELKTLTTNIEKILAENKDMNDEIVEDNKDTQDDIQEQNKETMEKWLASIERVQKKYREIEKTVSDVVGQVTSIFDQGFKNQEIKLENRYNTEKEAIEKSVQNEADKTRAFEQLDAQYSKKRAALKRKQAITDKAAAIVKAIMDTASAVVEALPNIPLSIAVGTLGGVQTGIIAAQPIPSFARGGSFVTAGPQLMMVGDNATGREQVTVTPLPDRKPKRVILQIGEKEFEGWLQDEIDSGKLRTVRAT
jgi:hypothetical protein